MSCYKSWFFLVYSNDAYIFLRVAKKLNLLWAKSGQHYDRGSNSKWRKHFFLLHMELYYTDCLLQKHQLRRPRVAIDFWLFSRLLMDSWLPIWLWSAAVDLSSVHCYIPTQKVPRIALRISETLLFWSTVRERGTRFENNFPWTNVHGKSSRHVFLYQHLFWGTDLKVSHPKKPYEHL